MIFMFRNRIISAALCLCLLLISIGAKAAGTSVDVIADYSAAGNGTTDDRAAIQAAIDAVHAAGGGTVTLTAGKTFLSGNLILRSNVELHFGDGAVLKQNPDQNAYVKPEGDTLVSYTPARGHNTISGVRWGHSFYKSYPLIYAGEGTTNVKITGAGTIEMTPEEKCADTIHLCPVGLYRVSNFTISDITIIKSSAYGMMPFTCTDGLIQNVTMKDFVSSTPDVADHLNGDGISLQNCQNIRVTGCNLSVTDDAIYIFTSYRDPRGGTWWNSNNPQPSTNIEIDHNITQTTCKGFGLILWGSSCPDQYKVEVSNVHVHDNTFSSMGIWNDDPFDDLSVPTPAKNIRFENNTIKKIQDNFYATPISDMNVYPSMTGFRNTGFEDREVYWVAVRNNDASSIGTSNYGCGQDGTYFAYLQNVHTGPAELYQGLYLEAKTIYSFSAKMMTKGNPFQMFVRNLDTQEIIASQDYSTASYSTGAWELKTLNFTVPASGNYQIGIRTKDGITYGSGDAARIDSVSMTSAPISEKSIFTTQFPDKFGNDNVYELGTRFKALVKGRITKVRLYTHAEESGIHTVRLWDFSGKKLLAGPYEWDVAAGTDGWQEFTLPTPLSIEANKDYVVAISNSSDNKYYAQGTQAENSLASSVSNGYLVGYAKGGLWFRGTGSMPYNAINNNYFRDVVFEPDEQTIFTTQTPTDFDNDTFYELGTRFQTRKDGFITRVRLYTNAEESGIHTVRLWDYSAKTLVAGPYEWDVAAGTDGWQEFSLPAPLSVEAGKDYVVAISNNAGNKLYVRGSDVGNSFTTAIRIGDLVTYSGSGLWSRTAGQMPYNKSTTNYFRDVVFVTDSINRDALRNAVNANKDKTQGNYTDATWQAFTAALSSAQAVLSDTAATQAQVNEAAAALSAAANDLAEPKVITAPTITMEPASFVYDGTTKVPTVTVKDGDDVIPESEYLVRFSTHKNAGTATVSIINKDGGNYTVSGTTTFTIHPAPLTIKADDKSVFMGESMPELTYQVTGLVSGESLTTAPTLTCAADMTAVGEFDITVAGADAGSNYTITYEKGILTVKEADKASLRELVNRYQNTPQGNYTDDSWKVLQDALTGAKAVLSNQNATAAQIKAAMEALYTAADGLTEIKLVQNPTVVLDKNSFVYDGTAKKPTVVVKDGDTVIDPSEYDVVYGNNVNAGTATVAVVDKDGGLYDVDADASFAITPAPVSILVEDKTTAVGATVPKLTYTVSGLIGSDKLIKEPSLTCTPDMTKAGKYPIAASGADFELLQSAMAKKDQLETQLEEKMEKGHVILDIEPVGARNVKNKRPDATLIFILPPSAEELERPLRELKNRCRYNRTGLLPQAEAEAVETDRKLRELEMLEEQSQKLRRRCSELEAQISQLENHPRGLPGGRHDLCHRAVFHQRTATVAVVLGNAPCWRIARLCI